MSERPDILTVGLSPAIQKSILFKEFTLHDVNRSTTYYTDAAGKCINVCRVLVQGGYRAECLTLSGRDNAKEFQTLCERDGIALTAVPTGKKVRTCTTIIEMITGDCTELVVNEPEVVTPEEEEAFKKIFIVMLDRGYKAVVISGSKFRGYSDEIIPFIVKETKKRGMLSIVDIKGKDLLNSYFSKEIRPDYVKINDDEFLETFTEYDDVITGIKDTTKRYDNAYIISRGSSSSLIATATSFDELPSKQLVPVNPIGCGDSMTAGLAGGLVCGLSLYESVVKGIGFAAKNVKSVHPGWIID